MSTQQPATILTVEDSNAIRRLIAYNLERAGYTVLEAENGKEAVRSLQNSVPDLIILDVRMPEMNGFQLLELMRRYPKAAAIPVIMLSALSQPENIDRALALGVVDYLVKPLDPTVLIAKVQEALSSAGRQKQDWSGPNRRQFRRAAVRDVSLEPQPGGRATDISEGGLAWRTKNPPEEGDVILLEAHELFDALGLADHNLRVRVIHVGSVGLGYHRVGAAFIGLSAGTRDSIRRYVENGGSSKTEE
jgi:CheY-like chemotaxis protein